MTAVAFVTTALSKLDFGAPPKVNPNSKTSLGGLISIAGVIWVAVATVLALARINTDVGSDTSFLDATSADNAYWATVECRAVGGCNVSALWDIQRAKCSMPDT